MASAAPTGYVRFKPYGGKCWWCGDSATSREHRHKRSDVVRLFGYGKYEGPGAPVRGVGERLRDIRGPNSMQLKFPASLCHNCNTARSQPFDRAYEAFIDYLHEHGELILGNNLVDYKNVFGSRWRQQLGDLTRYIVKHACCRLAEADLEVGPELSDFLNGNSQLRAFAISFEIREDILALKTREGVGGLWIGDLYCIRHQPSGAARNIGSFIGHEWLRILWRHDISIGRHPQRRRLALARGWNVDPAALPQPRTR